MPNSADGGEPSLTAKIYNGLLINQPKFPESSSKKTTVQAMQVMVSSTIEGLEVVECVTTLVDFCTQPQCKVSLSQFLLNHRVNQINQKVDFLLEHDGKVAEKRLELAQIAFENDSFAEMRNHLESSQENALQAIFKTNDAEKSAFCINLLMVIDLAKFTFDPKLKTFLSLKEVCPK